MSGSGRYEYKVKWQREGSSPTYRLRQSLVAAEREVKRQISAHDDIREWFTDYSTGVALTDWSRVPKQLVSDPVILRRTVGEWEEITDELQCPECGAMGWGNANCATCRSHWPGGDPFPNPKEQE